MHVCREREAEGTNVRAMSVVLRTNTTTTIMCHGTPCAPRSSVARRVKVHTALAQGILYSAHVPKARTPAKRTPSPLDVVSDFRALQLHNSHK